MNKVIMITLVLVTLMGGVTTLANETTNYDNIFDDLGIPLYNNSMSISKYTHKGIKDEHKSEEWHEYVLSNNETFSSDYIDSLHKYVLNNTYCYSSTNNKLYNKAEKPNVEYGDIFFNILDSKLYFIYVPYDNKSTLRNKIVVINGIGYYLWINRDTEFEENLFTLTGKELQEYINNQLKQELKIDE